MQCLVTRQSIFHFSSMATILIGGGECCEIHLNMWPYDMCLNKPSDMFRNDCHVCILSFYTPPPTNSLVAMKYVA